jgi:hypothetical protein
LPALFDAVNHGHATDVTVIGNCETEVPRTWRSSR